MVRNTTKKVKKTTVNNKPDSAIQISQKLGAKRKIIESNETDKSDKKLKGSKTIYIPVGPKTKVVEGRIVFVKTPEKQNDKPKRKIPQKI